MKIVIFFIAFALRMEGVISRIKSFPYFRCGSPYVMDGAAKKNRRIVTLLALIIGGEAVFFLPFVMARIFRPTLLEVFGVSNTEIGAWFSVYGLVAVVSYLFGGILADRYPARNLMASALWLTSLGGLLVALTFAKGLMPFVYGFWGFTSIFLFWAAMIRATREWGGTDYQGRAFGWLEGGRGATAALMGTLAFLMFYAFSGETDAAGGAGQRVQGFRMVVLGVSLLTFLSGVMIWFLVPGHNERLYRDSWKVQRRQTAKLLGMPTVWLLSAMIVCAYVGYKITDDFSLYAREVLDFSELNATAVGTSALWLRALAAMLTGHLADRLRRTTIIRICYGLTLAGGLLVASGWLAHPAALAIFNLFMLATRIYAVRALYFAVLKEAGIPLPLTGTAVGIVSLAGFTPDIFMSPWMGYLLDRYPGAAGHQYVFLVLAGFAACGLLASSIFPSRS